MSKSSANPKSGEAMIEARSTLKLSPDSALLPSIDCRLDVLRSKLQRRHLRLLQCINSLVLHRSQTHNGWQYCADARSFHEESLQALHEALAKGDGDERSSLARTHNLRKQATEDLEVLLARSQDTKAQEERRIALEGRFELLQQSFMLAVDDFMDAVTGLAPRRDPSGAWNSGANTSADASVEDERPPTETDPLLERYFDRAGELQLLGERLADLDYAYQEAVAASEMLKDQGVLDELADADRQKGYLRQRSDLEATLDAAIAESDELKRLCVAKGLLPLQVSMAESTSILVAEESLQSSHEADSEPPRPTRNIEDALVPLDHAGAAIMSQTDRLTDSSAPLRKLRPNFAQSRSKVVAWIASTDLEPLPDLPLLSSDELDAGVGKLLWLLDYDLARSRSGMVVRLRQYVSMPELRSR